MAYSKVIVNGTTVMDVTQDTVNANNTLTGFTGHKNDGASFTGSYTPIGMTITDVVEQDGGTVRTISGTEIIGTKQITENGTHDVSSYAFAEVNVNSGGLSWDDLLSGNIPSGEITFTGTSLPRYALGYRYSTNEWHFYAPNCTYSNQDTLRNNLYLKSARLPNLTSIHNTGYIFYGCTRLELIDWGSANLRGNNFTNCTYLTTLILRKTSALQTCNNTSVFNGTPFDNGGTGGTIYIPEVLYNHLGDGSELDYKAATNWVVYDGYGTITWAKLEGSNYEDPAWGHTS